MKRKRNKEGECWIKKDRVTGYRLVCMDLREMFLLGLMCKAGIGNVTRFCSLVKQWTYLFFYTLQLINSNETRIYQLSLHLILATYKIVGRWLSTMYCYEFSLCFRDYPVWESTLSGSGHSLRTTQNRQTMVILLALQIGSLLTLLLSTWIAIYNYHWINLSRRVDWSYCSNLNYYSFSL